MSGKKKIIALVSGICLIAGVCVLTFKPKKEENVKRDREHTVIVEDITVGIEGAGAARLEGIEQSFNISGIVEKIYVNKGDKVEKGSKIAKLSEKEINQQIEEAESEQKTKSKALSDLKKQNTSGDISINEQIKQAQKELDEINKKIKMLKSNLNNVYIYAASDGIVLDIKGEVGANITASSPIVTIGNEGKVYMDVLLPQTDIINVKEDQEVKVTFETYPDDEVKGIVKQKSYVSSEQGGDVEYKVKAELDTEGLEIYQGMTGEITFIIKSKENVMQIPNKAITIKDNKQIVKVKENEQIREVEIKTGFSDGKVTEVIEGLQEGQIVIEER